MPKKTENQTEGKSSGKTPKKRRRTQVTVGHKIVEGKRVPIRRFPSATSLTKLGDKVKELKRIHGAGGPGALADVLFQPYAERWLESKAGEVSDNTLRGYKSYLKNNIYPHIGNKQVQGILPSDIKTMMGKLKHLSINTRGQVIGIIKAMFNMAMDDHIRVDSPARAIKRIRDTEPKRRALTEAEDKATLKFIAERQGSAEATMAALLYYNGTRRGETMGLQWKHFDFENRRIKIEQQLLDGKGGARITTRLKNKNAYRHVPMQEALYAFLWPLRGLPKVFVFQDKGGNHYTSKEVENLWNSVREQCPALAGISPHYYRHNYATQLYKAGVPIKEAALYFGDTVKIMLETYAHIEDELKLNPDSKAYNIFPSVAQMLPK
jgi:integrase